MSIVFLFLILMKYWDFFFLQDNIKLENLNNYNVFWKLLFYLNSSSMNINVILTVLVFYLLFWNLKIKIHSFFLFFIVILISNLWLDFNSDLFDFSNINKELYNGILIIHPITTYICFVLFLKIWLSLKKKIYIFFSKKNEYLYDFLKNINYNLMALFLGSCWAQQELNWGGWWGWDSVEIILFSTILLNLFAIHIFKNFKKFFNVVFYFFNVVFYFFIFYFIVRSNFTNSVHAFSISEQIQKHFYVLMFINLIIFIYYNLIKKYVLLKRTYFLINNYNSYIFLKNFLKKYNYFGFLNSILIILTFILFGFYFYKNQININVYYYFSFFIKTIIILYIYIYFFTISKKINIYIILVSFVLYPFYKFNIFIYFFTIFSYFLFLKNSSIFFKKTHYIIIILIVLSVGYYQFSPIFSYFFVNLKLNFKPILLYQNDFFFFFDKSNWFFQIFFLFDFNFTDFFFLKKNIINSVFIENQNDFDLNLYNHFCDFFCSNLIFEKNKLNINYNVDATNNYSYDLYLFWLYLFWLYFYLLFNFFKKVKSHVNGIV